MGDILLIVRHSCFGDVGRCGDEALICQTGSPCARATSNDTVRVTSILPLLAISYMRSQVDGRLTRNIMVGQEVKRHHRSIAQYLAEPGGLFVASRTCNIHW